MAVLSSRLIFDLGLPWHIYMPVMKLAAPLGDVRNCLVCDAVFLGVGAGIFADHPGASLVQSPDLQDDLGLAAPVDSAFDHRRDHPFHVAPIFSGIVVPDHATSCAPLVVQSVDPLYVLHQRYRCRYDGIDRGRLHRGVHWFKREMDSDLLTRLGKGAILPLGLYLALRLSDQWIRGILPGAIDGSWQSVLFLAEILLGGILPIIFLSVKKIRETREGLLTSAILANPGYYEPAHVAQYVHHELRAEGTSYVPSLGETLIAFAIPAAAVFAVSIFSPRICNCSGSRPRG
jgi:hypothetical protein